MHVKQKSKKKLSSRGGRENLFNDDVDTKKEGDIRKENRKEKLLVMFIRKRNE